MSPVIPLRPADCQRVRGWLDSYLSGELLVETTLEIERHLDRCPECAAELAVREGFRDRLRQAVASQPAPADLESKVRRALRAEAKSRRWRLSGWYALAAMLLLACGWAVSLAVTGFTPIGYIQHEIYIAELWKDLPGVIRWGVADHVHCAYYRRYGAPQSVEKTLEELGPRWAPLAAETAAAAPAGYAVRLAHRCSYHGREFVHLALTDASARPVSLVVTQKRPGERWQTPAASGGELRWAEAQIFRLAGFESDEYYGFIVSELPRDQHLALSARLAGPVSDYLNRVRPPWDA